MSSKKIDAKPRQKAGPGVVNSRARAKSRLTALKAGANTEATGSVAMADRAPTGRKVGYVFGEIAGVHRLSMSPAVTFSYHVRRALGAIRHPRPDVKIYGPDGVTVIATYNPETRVRTPIDDPAARSSDPQES